MSEDIAGMIVVLRGQRVILDADLAQLYGVTTKAFNQAVKRNLERFPEDFSFVLTRQELTILRSQNVTTRWGGRRYLPRAFTEHGAIMAAMVLNSKRATEMSVFIVRAFVRMRETLAATAELAKRLKAVETTLEGHDESIKALVAAVRQLMLPPPAKRRQIGFVKEGKS